MGTKGLLCCLLLTVLLSSSNGGLVKKILRHRRETPASSLEHNITLPTADRPVVFNHVYNINVPGSPLCSVDVDPSESTSLGPGDARPSSGPHLTEQAVDGENQIVFTHRINIPRQACGCSEDLPGLKELLSRLEVLEGEVSALRGQCNGGAGCCNAQVTGEVGTKPFCNGHGNYSADSCGCVCEAGWRGTNCTEPECPSDCHGRGLCVDGACKCFKGFSGENCLLDVCPVDCGPHGRCVGGVCICLDGFYGDDCSDTKCINNCQGRGLCRDGDCVCDIPWTGIDCSELICPKGCNANGRCVNGTCYCNEGYAGEDCSDHSCLHNCKGNGFCVDGQCVCSAGYSGVDCSQLTCLNDCSGRGTCFNGVCICDTGYQGEDCSQLACLDNCNNRGQCINGQCACDVGFQGADCSELSCPRDCQHRGRCVNGQCVCDEGYAGEDCSIRVCPSNCYGHGECIDGRCMCYAGFSGEDCGEVSCPNNCQHRGHCIDGQCVCDEGFTGEDCRQKACPNDCLGRGHCVNGSCVCQEGYSGDDCAILSCADNCNNRGRCIDGICVCETGYEGESCAELSCLYNCHKNGRCVNGQCLCDEGFIGDDCSEVSPPKDLTLNVASKTVDLSWNNEMLVTEYLVTYVPIIPGGLRQEFTVSGDKTSATVKELEPGMEYEISVYAVLSNKRSVPVNARVVTALPQPEGLRFKAVRETSVEVTWDPLDFPFDGWEIYFRNTKEENGKVVSTLPSSQNQFVQSGLGPGQEYEVSINLIKSRKKGPQTSQIFTTLIDSPSLMEAKDVTDSSALVSWSQPVAPVESFLLFYGPTSDPADIIRAELTPLDQQFSIDGLRPDTEYMVSLSSRSGNVTSDPVTTTFTTDLDEPQNLLAVSKTDGSITLEWTNSQADVGSYRVKYSPISGATHGEDVFPQGPGDTTKATIAGLIPGTEYGIGVTAMKNERESLPATTNAETDIDPPGDFEATDSMETSVSLRWQRPQAKISGYRLVYVSADVLEFEVDIPPTANSYVLSGLTPGTGYNLTLTAERGHKRSSPVKLTASTALFTFYLAGSDDHGPTAPTGPEDNVISFVNLDLTEPQFSGMEPEEDELGALTVSGISADGFDLSWKLKPQSLYDSFTVEYKDTQRLWEANEVQLPGSAAGSRIQGLTASTEYQIKLYGITSSQRSALLEAVAVTAPVSTSPHVLTLSVATTAQSALDNDTVLTSGPPRPVVTEAPPTSESAVTSSQTEPRSPNLDVLENLRVTNITSNSLGLDWSAPDEAFESVVVELRSGSEESPAHVTTLPGNVTKAEIEGLSPSTHYNITVQGLVEGKRSLPVKLFATTAEEGSNPQLVDLTLSDVTWDSFTVSWTPRGGEFDSFVLEVTNQENFAESQNLTLSGDAFSLGIAGLNPNTSYLVGLFGVSQGSILAPLYIEATTVNEPDVGNLYLTNLTSESFSIHWNETDGGFDGFILEIIDSDWLMEPVEFNMSHSVQSRDVTGLRPSTDYIAYLYGTYKGSRTRAVSIVASTAEEPDLSKLVVYNVTSDRFSLSWRTREKAFDNFVVEVRESASPSRAMGRALPGDVRSTLMAGLKSSTSYDIKLYGSSGGQKTPPLFAVASTEDVPQMGPMSAASVSPHNLSLSWSTVSGHFDGFVMRVSDSEQQSDPLEFRLPAESRNFTISNLMDATGYDIELYGISHGRPSPSVLTHAITAPLPKVENLTISEVTPYGFRVSWEVKQQQQQQQQQEDDVSPSSGGFRHFHIVVTDSGWLLEPQEFTVPGNQSHLDIWGLITGIGYEVRLTGVSESGLLSRPLTTVAATEAEPEVEHLFVSDITADGFRLSWAADEDMFDRFVIKIRDSKKVAHPREFNVRGDERTKVLTGLMSGTEYEIELFGVSLDQRSQPITGVAQTGLSTPRELHFSEVSDSSAIVHWSMPSSPVDSYRVAYVPFEGGSPMTVTVDGGVFEALMANMVPGKTYQVTVTAVKGLEESDASTDTVTTALDRPEGLTALNVTDTSALLLWQPSVATVDGYVISYGADSVASVMEHVSGNTAEFEVDSLFPGTHYSISVHAIKQSQKSESAVTEFTTDVDPPRDLKATNIQPDGATLTWQPPQAPVTGYTLTFSAPGGEIREVVLSSTASTYSMSELAASTEYSVRLQAVSGAQRSRLAATDFKTSKHAGTLFPRPRDCAQILLNGETTSGLYRIYVGGEEGPPLQVYCDMDTDGGGWTVLLRRQNGKLEFYRNWKNYTAGFGNMNDEFWLGLSNVHKITSSGHYELRVDMTDRGDSAYALYDKFTIAEPRTRYKLYIGAYSGTAGDSLTYHQGRPFSTYDNDNDIAVTNCALSYKGAFWYKNCHRVNLMGKYGDTSHSKGINWFHWKGHEHSIEFAEMKIRPADFRNLESRKKR